MRGGGISLRLRNVRSVLLGMTMVTGTTIQGIFIDWCLDVGISKGRCLAVRHLARDCVLDGCVGMVWADRKLDNDSGENIYDRTNERQVEKWRELYVGEIEENYSLGNPDGWKSLEEQRDSSL